MSRTYSYTIPFSIEKYETGKYEVFTRSGRPVRVICVDKKTKDNFKVVALVLREDGYERGTLYTTEGCYETPDPITGKTPEDSYDLILSRKVTLSPAEVKMSELMYGEGAELDDDKIELVKHNTKVMRKAFAEPRQLSNEEE